MQIIGLFSGNVLGRWNFLVQGRFSLILLFRGMNSFFLICTSLSLVYLSTPTSPALGLKDDTESHIYNNQLSLYT